MSLVPTEAEKMAFRMCEDVREMYKERMELLKIIKDLVINTPNDQELGKELRRLISMNK